MSCPILIDCDGVLTDGELHIDSRGEKFFKSFHTRDVRSIRELIYRGFEVFIVTADDWSGIHFFADKVNAEVIVSRTKTGLLDKLHRPLEHFIAVGDDAWDVSMLKAARRAYCPRNADWSVKCLPGTIILDCDGGKGVIAELLRHLIEHPL